MVATEITVVIATEIKEATEIVTMEVAVIKATGEITNLVTESKEVMVATGTMIEIRTTGSEVTVETETDLIETMTEVIGLPKRASTEMLAVVACLIAVTSSKEEDSDPLEVDHSNPWLPCHQTLKTPNQSPSKL